MYTISSAAHNAEMLKAIDKIKKSKVVPYIVDVLLYGSCARDEQTEDSDVDIAMILSDEISTIKNYTSMLADLRGAVMSTGYMNPDVDLHFVFQSELDDEESTFIFCLKMDGKTIWQ